MVKPYVIMSLATYTETSGEDFWAKFVALMKNFDPDLCPDYFGYNEIDLKKRKYPFSDLFEDHKKFSSPMISRTGDGPELKSFRTLFWRHTKPRRSDGNIYHERTILDGTKLCATLNLNFEWRKNVDYDDFFENLLKISDPILAMCHFFTSEELASPSLAYYFQDGILGQRNPLIDDLPQRLFIKSGNVSSADIKHFKSSGYRSQKIASGMYFSHHMLPERSNAYYIKFNTDRAKLKNLIGDKTPYYKKYVPEPPMYIKDGVLYHGIPEGQIQEPIVEGPHTYDKAKWHYEADDFPKDKPESHGYTHTGFYIAWLAEQGLMSEDYEKEVKKFLKTKRKQGPIYLYQMLGGCLFETMLSDKGNAFAKDYFEFETGAYLQIYQEVLGKDLESLYHILPSWENYDLLKPILDAHFETWKSANNN